MRNEPLAIVFDFLLCDGCLLCIKSKSSPCPVGGGTSDLPYMDTGGEHERAIVPKGTIAPEGGSGYGTPLQTWDGVKSLRS